MKKSQTCSGQWECLFFQACSSFVLTDGAQAPLWILLPGKKSFKRYPTSSALKSHPVHISCVRNPSTVPIPHLQEAPSPSVSKCSSWEMFCSGWIWALAAFYWSLWG